MRQHLPVPGQAHCKKCSFATNQVGIGQLRGAISCEGKGWREHLMDGSGLTDCAPGGSRETLMHCTTTCSSDEVSRPSE